jgi:choline dehydrogenase-like flavoprotein
VTAEPLEGGEPVRFELGRLVLAAGALCTTKILLDSIFRRSGRIEAAGGLMDNRQVHVPFLTLGLIGTEVDTSAYQFHQIAFGLDRGVPARYVHGQITTLKAASLHPILQSLPMDLRSALSAFQRLRAGLGVANVNLPDSRREASRVTIQPSGGVTGSNLVLDYVPDSGEEDESKSAVRTIRRSLRRLGCLPVPGMTRTLPKGNSVHYAGTLPMTASPRPFATAPDGRSWDFPNLYVVDGAVLPALPSINHTLTLMANATRVAEKTLD